MKLPGFLNEHGEENKSVYNKEKGCFTCRIEKRTPGETFLGLESISSLTQEFEMDEME